LILIPFFAEAEESLSGEAKRSAFAQSTSKAWVMLLVIDHEDLSEPIRLTSNETNLIVDGNVYVAFGFDIDMPDEGDDVPQVQVRVDNVDRKMVDTIRALTSPPDFSLSVVLSDTPDLIEAGPFDMTLQDCEYDVLSITGNLTFDNILSEPFPAESFNPQEYPGLF
jgi:hypothetical protein